MRGLIKALASGLDRAEHDVFVAPQVHVGCGDAPPTALDKAWYWCNGFKKGFTECRTDQLQERHGRASQWWKQLWPLKNLIIRSRDRKLRDMKAPKSVAVEDLTEITFALPDATYTSTPSASKTHHQQ